MIIKLEISSDSNLNEIKDKLILNGIDIIDESLTIHGNYELTIIADTKAKVLLVADLYFG